MYMHCYAQARIVFFAKQLIKVLRFRVVFLLYCGRSTYKRWLVDICIQNIELTYEFPKTSVYCYIKTMLSAAQYATVFTLN